MLNMHLPTPWYRGAGKGALNSMPHSINVCTCPWVQLQTQDATVGNTRENCCCAPNKWIFYADVYLATALVPSLIACLASSPGSMSRTAVCISRDVSVNTVKSGERAPQQSCIELLIDGNNAAVRI